MLGDKAAEGEGEAGAMGVLGCAGNRGAMVIGGEGDKGEGDKGEGNRIQTHRWAGAEKTK